MSYFAFWIPVIGLTFAFKNVPGVSFWWLFLSVFLGGLFNAAIHKGYEDIQHNKFRDLENKVDKLLRAIEEINLKIPDPNEEEIEELDDWEFN